jgi:hypothetical protein
LTRRAKHWQNDIIERVRFSPRGAIRRGLLLLAAKGSHNRSFAPGFVLFASRQLLKYRTHHRQNFAEIGHWYEPDKLMGYCVALYFAKLLVWDKVLGFGSTDPLAGFAAITANLVVSFYFAKRGFENVARIIKR